MFNFNSSRKAGPVLVAVEYYAPHWVVLIKNPGSTEWTSLRSTTKNIKIFDEFGSEVGKRPAIETFGSDSAARDWVAANLPKAQYVNRTQKDISAFFAGLQRPLKGINSNYAAQSA